MIFLHPYQVKTKSLVAYFLLLLLCLNSTFSFASVDNRVRAASQQFTTNDFSHWLAAAKIADATYKSKQQIEDALRSQGYALNLYKQLDGYMLAYVVATNNKTRQHIIAIRGTSNIENVMVNAAFVLMADDITGISIHQGFLLSARDIYQQILAELKPGYKINTIGHSLGGAAALIVAMMLDAQGFTIGEAITFGQPKVTNISGSRKFKHLNIKRLVTPKDIVPLVPPLDPMDLMNLSIFWHQGTEVILYENHQYAVLSGTDSMLRMRDFLNDVPGEQHLTNHFMDTYIRHLESKLKTAEEVKFSSDFKFSDWFGSSTKSTK